MPENLTTQTELSMWQAQSLRVTAFPNEPDIKPGQTWWQDLFGEPADKTTSQLKQILHQEQGALGNGILLLTIQPGRINWQLDAQLQLQEAAEKMPAVGTVSDALGIFMPPMLRWLAVCPVLKRLAFGAKLIQTTEGHVAGYSLLSKYLHSVKIDPESSDFSYQINRARQSRSRIPNLRINRLSKWVLLQIQMQLFAIDGRVTTTPPRYGCLLELDINTSPEFEGELPKAEYPALLEELVELGKEIALKGDIP